MKIPTVIVASALLAIARHTNAADASVPSTPKPSDSVDFVRSEAREEARRSVEEIRVKAKAAQALAEAKKSVREAITETKRLARDAAKAARASL